MNRWILGTVIGWVLANALVLAVDGGRVPFDWPEPSLTGRVVSANAALLEVLLLIGVTYALTRRRTTPDIALGTSKETLLLLAYGVLGLAGGFILGRVFGWHPFGFHLAGTLYGTHEHVAVAEALSWAGYNLIVYAVLPLAFFRRRYSPAQLCLRSRNRRGDLLVIVVVLAIETVVQLVALGDAVFHLSARQIALGMPLTFALYFAGTVLPTMIFIYALLVPRYLKITGSVPGTVVLGGLTYTLMHCLDAWTVFGSPGTATLSVVFLVFTYFGPGMIKTVLTLRTGNAWVHVWAYHALAPHTLEDTPLIVHIFKIT